MLIAVAVLPATCSVDGESRWITRISDVRPTRIGESWRFLGFDVADEYLESAIDIHGSLSAEAPRPLGFNPCSLFNGVDDAARFMMLMNQQHPEQQPFCIFGIWAVR